ncbi:hypothetical protein HN960_00905 [Candidatus Peregrinibacteria bacterium]|jgi:hypothetical protein|nr:hypothetical protein [Candidatus Peregrinibacteria bacterium]MBT6730418.1 hypothetical protein [Candidatus Peregrinibacteria bacterium]MBT7008982.1 hypothetical protein [Candidatus Peregrinibacteria bacterium]MBT7344879.1 hypothetical protein [Candidatus Peregrinibacteria bacterium]MBT7928846.1 hypothetical protein [Candidatus Peregrinibacteria bacterium]
MPETRPDDIGNPFETTQDAVVMPQAVQVELGSDEGFEAKVQKPINNASASSLTRLYKMLKLAGKISVQEVESKSVLQKINDAIAETRKELIAAGVDVDSIDKSLLNKNERDERVVTWAAGTEFEESNVFLVQGIMIKRTKRWVENLMTGLEKKWTPGFRIEYKIFQDTAFFLCNVLARSYDPMIHGNDFNRFVLPYIDGVVFSCIKDGRCVVNNKMTLDELAIYKERVDLTTLELGSSRVSKAVDTSAQGRVTERQNPKEARDDRLLLWAVQNKHTGRSTSIKDIQGSIISRFIPRSNKLAGDIKESSSMSYKDYSTAGYRVLNKLARIYDPGLHGEDFWKFAKPYIEKALDLCEDRKCILIPEAPTDSFIEALLIGEVGPAMIPEDVAPQPEEKPKQALSKSDRLIDWADKHGYAGKGSSTRDIYNSMKEKHIGQVNDMAANIQRTSRLHNEALSNAVSWVLGRCTKFFDPQKHGEDFWEFAEPYIAGALDHCVEIHHVDFDREVSKESLEEWKIANAPSENTNSTDPVKTETKPEVPKKELSPEEKEEDRRRRRICRLAKDSFEVEVNQDQYDEAVQGLCEAHEKMFKGIVKKLEYNGNKSRIRNQCNSILNEIINKYDPGESEGIEFSKQEDKEKEIAKAKAKAKGLLSAFIKNEIEARIQELIN